MTDKRKALALVREDDYKYDKWGTCMLHWFGVAEALADAGYDVPPDWEYRPAMGGGIDGPPGENYAEMMAEGDLSADDLVYAGNVLGRWSDLLKHAGEDY